jgi:hypothetical protein
VEGALNKHFHVAILLALGACGGESLRAPQGKVPIHDGTSESTFGIRVNGLRLGLTSDKICVLQDERLVITEELKNIGDHPIHANFRSFSRSCELIEDYFEVLKEHDSLLLHIEGLEDAKRGDKIRSSIGHIIGDDEVEGFPFHSFTSSHYSRMLKPGESRRFALTVRPRRPGVYRFRSDWSSDYSADHQDDLWRGTLTSNDLIIDVQPNKELYDRLGGLTLSLRSPAASLKSGEPLGIIGTLANTGARAVAIVPGSGLLKIRSIETGRTYRSSGIGKPDAPAGNPASIDLEPGDSLDFFCLEPVQATQGPVKLRCGLSLVLKIGETPFGTVIHSARDLELTVDPK